MLSRAMERETFGKRLYEHGMTQHSIAESFADLQMARLLTLDCAAALDQVGARQARAAIASLKATVPLLCYAIVDRAVQVHGALGVSGETFLAQALAGTLLCCAMYLTLLFHSSSAHFAPFFLVCTKLCEAFGSPTVPTMCIAAP